jgi:STE24 endopeptidase
VANEDRSARYHRSRRRAAVGSAVLGGSFFGLLLFTGASAALRDAVGALTGPSLVPLVAGYVVVLLLVHELVHIPFAFYRGVRLERRYGLSAQSIAAWGSGYARAIVVVLVLAVAAALIVTGLARWMPDYWWIGAAVCFGAGLTALARMAPAVLLPRVCTLVPLNRPGLCARLGALADRAGARVSGVFEWRLSDGTRRARAALVGVGGTYRILLSDTLLSEHSDDEIEVILAHELAHHVHHHVWMAILLDTMSSTVALFAADRALAHVATSFGLTGKGDVAALPLVLLVAGAVSLALTPVANACSRAHERRADRFALETTGNAEAFVRVVRRLAAQNLEEERPSWLVRALFSTHPPAAARIAAAERWARRDDQRRNRTRAIETSSAAARLGA